MALILAKENTGFNLDEDPAGSFKGTPAALMDLSPQRKRSRLPAIPRGALDAALFAGLGVAAWLRFDRGRLLAGWVFLVALFVVLAALAFAAGSPEEPGSQGHLPKEGIPGGVSIVLGVAAHVYFWSTLFVLALVPPMVIPDGLLPGWPRSFIVLLALAGIALVVAVRVGMRARQRAMRSRGA